MHGKGRKYLNSTILPNTLMDWPENIPTDTATSHPSPSVTLDAYTNKEKETSQVIGKPVIVSPIFNSSGIVTKKKTKRFLSEATSTPKSPTMSDTPNSPTISIKHGTKISSQSNSFSQAEDRPIVCSLKSAESLFLDNNNIPISFLQYQYIIDNFSNESLNIHNLFKDVNSDILTIINITENNRPMITDSKMKSKLTRLT